MTASERRSQPGGRERSSPVFDGAIIGLGVAIGWIVLEVVFRWGLVSRLGAVLGDPLIADWTMLVLGFPVMAGVFGWSAARLGHPPAEWGYDWSLRPLIAGAGAVLVALVAVAVAAQVDAFLFPLERIGASFGSAIGEVLRATPVLAALLLLGNGFVVPLAEEAVWRGVVQSTLVEAWGVPTGIVLTAVLFATKHVIVDLSIVRVTTLLTLGLVLGLVRQRFGTASSTITHVGVNTVSTGFVIVAALA